MKAPSLPGLPDPSPVINHPHSVRIAQDSDAEPVARLFSELGYPCDSKEMRARLALIRLTPSHWVGVAERNQAVVGCCHIYCSPILEAGLIAQIGGMVVGEGHRGLGIGTALIAAAEAWAKRQGCTQVYVRTNIVRIDAHAFYEHIGYHRAKTQFAYRKSLQPPDLPPST